jgi:P27 family predicted phage terminase small subunit
MRGRKPNPTALRRASGNPGKRAYNPAEPLPPEGMPDCPPHLSAAAQDEWHRLARALFDMGVLTIVDRAALAAYCQCYGRWVEAEEKMAETPAMIRTPSGYVQQSPWMSVANKQLELMGRYMAELGITPASRSRVAALLPTGSDPVGKVEVVLVWQDAEGNTNERPIPDNRKGYGPRDAANQITWEKPVALDENI